jgi:hypothetical protein
MSKPILNNYDIEKMRGALVAVNLLISKLPDSSRLNKAGKRVIDRACDARIALRVLLEESDAGALNLAALAA